MINLLFRITFELGFEKRKQIENLDVIELYIGFFNPQISKVFVSETVKLLQIE